MTSRKLRGAPLAAVAAALALLAIPDGPAAAQVKPEQAITSVAFVNGDVVTNYDVQQRARLLGLIGRGGGDELRAEALESMIDDRLKRAAARSAGIGAQPQQVDEAVDAFMRSTGGSPEQVRADLRRAGVTDDALREFIETQVIWSALIRRDYGPRAEVTDLELEDEIEAEGLDMATTFVLGEIAIPTGGDPEAAERRIEEIAAEINAGADFSAMARKHSRSRSAASGGRMGEMPADRLPPPLVAELRELEPGKTTRPLALPGGVAVLTVFDMKQTPRELTDEDRERIRQRMQEQRLSRYAESRLQELRANAFIDRR